MKKILAAVCALCLCSSYTALAYYDEASTNSEDTLTTNNEDIYIYDDSDSYICDSNYSDFDSSDSSYDNSDNSYESSSCKDDSIPCCSAPDASSIPDRTPFYGDVNYDNRINSEDALTILKYVVGIYHFNDEQFKRADVNRDRQVNASDALGVLKYIVGLIDSFYAL